ncbi:MAG: hypothetical protein JSS83_27455 [Cyanobacteria bacterium SZAS LIN-3]|nr:hypothetical protein [Cyanobacteria bacterium SZAS LIN-3]
MLEREHILLRTDHHESLVQHLKHSDWQEHAHVQRDMPSTAHKSHLPELEISEHSRLQRTLSNNRLPASERLEAARHLIHDGVRAVHFKDDQGKEHDYRIQLSRSGRVKVTEGNEVVLQDVGGKAASSGVEGARRSGYGGHTVYSGRRPSGLRETAGGHYRYEEPSGGRSFEPAGNVDRHMWNGIKNPDGSVTIGFKGCQVDTDGRGAWRHPEDSTRQSATSLKLSDGRSLDTDKDNFFVLPPSVARAYGIHKGDLGWLVQKGSGNAVPVVFGDSGPEGKLGEASVAALKALGYDVNGRKGVSGDRFEIVFAPGSGDGTGDIASDPTAMAAKLHQSGLIASAGQIK